MTKDNNEASTWGTSQRGSIRRSRAILRAAFTALKDNPRLAWFPVLSAIGSLGLLAMCGAIAAIGAAVGGERLADLGGLWALVADADPDGDAAITRAMSVGGMVFYVGNHLLVIAMGVAMTHAALEALAGRPWTVRDSLRIASRRRRSIATFAIIQATVGHLLGLGPGRSRSRSRRRGRKRRRSPGLLARLGHVAWTAMTYLVLPVIAREGGGVRAIQRSAALFRKTWGEALLARVTLGWVWVPAVVIGAIPIAISVGLGVREPAVLVVAIVVPLLGLGVLGLVLYTLERIYRAALYTYATEGVIPEAFAGQALNEIWEARGGPDDFIDTDARESGADGPGGDDPGRDGPGGDAPTPDEESG